MEKLGKQNSFWPPFTSQLPASVFIDGPGSWGAVKILTGAKRLWVGVGVRRGVLLSSHGLRCPPVDSHSSW